MRVGLVVPCYIEMFYPRVGKSTLRLLENSARRSTIPLIRHVANSPWPTAVHHADAKATDELLVRNFADFDYVAAPSSSCVHQFRNKITADDTSERRHVSTHVWDSSEFLCDVIKVEEFPWARYDG